MAHLYTMDWTQYLELSSLERPIDWNSPCTSRERGQQSPLLTVFINITHGSPAAADRNNSIVRYAGESLAQPALK